MHARITPPSLTPVAVPDPRDIGPQFTRLGCHWKSDAGGPAGGAPRTLLLLSVCPGRAPLREGAPPSAPWSVARPAPRLPPGRRALRPRRAEEPEPASRRWRWPRRRCPAEWIFFSCLAPCSLPLFWSQWEAIGHWIDAILEQAGQELELCQQQADEVTEIMRNNFDKVLERDGKLLELEQRSDQLLNMSLAFSKTTKTLAQKKRWENIRCRIYLGLAVAGSLLIILIVLLVIFLPTSDGDSGKP
ncbi:vesicle-associated membrane protein 5 isoform X1 [Mesocricetus auratus]|uniref:Vesicle-associated membrane protein 5 n=1 Tax=Mesocricetus auratus TaxID=10036 RepID=A0A1U8C475_MESAU|nr:vesicle-associated membrane protein 5 isoform X1 [Mesocricetus auratus]